MSELVPLKSMFASLNNWPSFWDDDAFPVIPAAARELDVYEGENEVVVKANVAGVSPDDINVTFEKGVLWIQAKATKEEEDKKLKFYTKSSWNYSYKVTVPGLIDHSKEPDVSLENGVLKVSFAKSEASKPKKLTVKAK